MAVFQYRAYDTGGAERSGRVEAGGADEARQRLRSEGLLPFELTAENGRLEESLLGAGLSLAESLRFCRRMSARLRGGIPLTDALTGMEQQDAWGKRRHVLIQLREQIEGGADLSTAIERCETGFTPEMQAVLRVGEATVTLAAAFGSLAEHLERQVGQRRRLVGALVYPAVTAILAIGVVTFLLVFLVPTLSTMFANMHGKLPWITQALIFLGNGVRDNGLMLLGLLVVGLLVVRSLLRLARFRRALEYGVGRVPLLGDFLRHLAVEFWSRNAAMMLTSGVTLLEALQTLRKHSRWLMERDALETVISGLKEGESLAVGMKKTVYFPRFLIQLVEAGEASGELPALLGEAAAELEAENRSRVDVMLQVLEPLLIIVMGVVVGGIMVAVLLPMYEMNRLL